MAQKLTGLSFRLLIILKYISYTALVISVGIIALFAYNVLDIYKWTKAENLNIVEYKFINSLAVATIENKRNSYKYGDFITFTYSLKKNLFYEAKVTYYLECRD